MAAAIGVTALITTGAILFFITIPFETIVRPEISTLRGLTNVVMAKNYPTLLAKFNVETGADIWHTVQFVIAEQLGVDVNRVTQNARFVQDLGAD